MILPIMVDLPEICHQRFDMIAEYYDIPKDILAKKFMVDCINDIYSNTLLSIQKMKNEAER